MKLGILDVGGIEDAIALAPLADQLGYTRYWLAEHQPQPSPTLLASIVASQTERIRVGTAGVLLTYRPPLQTSHDFHLLERAYTGRIDAGFCGGLTPRNIMEPDLDGRDVAALVAAYPDRVRKLVRYLRNTRNSADFDPVLAWPEVGDEPPEIWSHGGGPRSAELAAELGLGLGYALMFPGSHDDPSTVRGYRERFIPHADRPEPAVVVAVAGVCAETDARAREIADGFANRFLFPRIVGGPATCAAALAELRERYGADEIAFLALCSARDDRARCYELLASACGLEPDGAAQDEPAQDEPAPDHG